MMPSNCTEKPKTTTEILTTSQPNQDCPCDCIPYLVCLICFILISISLTLVALKLWHGYGEIIETDDF